MRHCQTLLELVLGIGVPRDAERESLSHSTERSQVSTGSPSTIIKTHVEEMIVVHVCARVHETGEGSILGSRCLHLSGTGTTDRYLCCLEHFNYCVVARVAEDIVSE